MDINETEISVTALAEYICRKGDLASGSYGGISGIEGTRLHQKIFADLKKDYGEEMETEVVMHGIYEGDDLTIRVNGRADIIIAGNPETDRKTNIIEIKSFNSTKDSFEKLVRPEHEAQLKIYAAIYLNDHPDETSVNITLRYVSLTTFQAIEETVEIGLAEARKYFEEICGKYEAFAVQLIDYEESSMESVRTFSFPYSSIRPGQSQFMKNTLVSLTSMETLFVEAPTGTGKTISTLYPAIKGLQRRRYEKIFYVTAKKATRGVATKAINDMRNSGLLIRSILLESKEKMCPYQKKCDAKYCKLALGYYGRLKPALEEILKYDDIQPELVTEIALKHNICPHEFSLDTLNYCSVVIGDYNHVFDPRVSIARCFSDEAASGVAVLVDEAHNMVDRARTMYSAEFSYQLLRDMAGCFKGIDRTVEKYLMQLLSYMSNAEHCMETENSVFMMLEGVSEKQILKTEGWEGVRKAPSNLYGIMWRLCRFLSPVLDALGPGELRQKAMEFFFECRFFLTILEQHYNDSYITCIEKTGSDLILKLNCLDASSKIDSQIRDKMPVVFFSATLAPYEYYRNVLIGKDPDYCRHITLASPFPPENLEVIIDDSISTSYKNRSATAMMLTERITEELKDRHGNFMIFFPSFEYMDKILPLIQKEFQTQTLKDGEIRKIIKQRPEMTDSEKKEFLEGFNEPFNGVLLGGAVLGGHFGEGIDLVGDRLSGVIIVGVGIPKISAERQVLANYYTEKFGDGYAFAYRFPGWEKVLQAAGRVIRTEEDTGFVLLIDERLSNPEYISLYPDFWNI